MARLLQQPRAERNPQCLRQRQPLAGGWSNCCFEQPEPSILKCSRDARVRCCRCVECDPQVALALLDQFQVKRAEVGRVDAGVTCSLQDWTDPLSGCL